MILNITAEKNRRVDLVFGIGYNDSIEHAENILKEIVSIHELILKDPATDIKLHKPGEFSVDFVVRPWVRTKDYWTVYWDSPELSKIALTKKGFLYPIHRVIFICTVYPILCLRRWNISGEEKLFSVINIMFFDSISLFISFSFYKSFSRMALLFHSHPHCQPPCFKPRLFHLIEYFHKPESAHKYPCDTGNHKSNRYI